MASSFEMYLKAGSVAVVSDDSGNTLAEVARVGKSDNYNLYDCITGQTKSLTLFEAVKYTSGHCGGGFKLKYKHKHRHIK